MRILRELFLMVSNLTAAGGRSVVVPTGTLTSPTGTSSPFLTAIASRWLYVVISPLPWADCRRRRPGRSPRGASRWRMAPPARGTQPPATSLTRQPTGWRCPVGSVHAAPAPQRGRATQPRRLELSITSARARWRMRPHHRPDIAPVVVPSPPGVGNERQGILVVQADVARAQPLRNGAGGAAVPGITAALSVRGPTTPDAIEGAGTTAAPVPDSPPESPKVRTARERQTRRTNSAQQ